MEGEVRREKILDLLEHSNKPLSGTVIAKMFSVSRQVIVQDIALLRAVNKNILSTNKGYLLYHPKEAVGSRKRTFAVKHTDAQMLEELYTIVDMGGKVLDVVVEHGIYGQITADLVLKNRADAEEFVEKIKTIPAQPLKTLTNDLHFHTVEAESEEVLDKIENVLQSKGFLYIAK